MIKSLKEFLPFLLMFFCHIAYLLIGIYIGYFKYIPAGNTELEIIKELIYIFIRSMVLCSFASIPFYYLIAFTSKKIGANKKCNSSENTSN